MAVLRPCGDTYGEVTSPPRRSNTLFAVRLSPLRPIFLHAPADLTLLRRAHRLAAADGSAINWRGRCRCRGAATAQARKRPIDSREFLCQFADAGFRTASRIFLEIEFRQRGLQLHIGR